MARSIAEALASTIQAQENCIKAGNNEWEEKHGGRIEELMQTAPSGSGIDSGTTLDADRTTAERLVFDLGYHHMNGGGYYDGWTEHTVKAVPSFSGITVTVSGRNRNDIKDYLGELYHDWLTSDAPEIS